MLRQIVVNLTSFPLTNGQYKILTRLRGSDKEIVELAHKALDITQADFCRAMMVNGAREVLRQLGIPEPTYTKKAQPDADTEIEPDTDQSFE